MLRLERLEDRNAPSVTPYPIVVTAALNPALVAPPITPAVLGIIGRGPDIVLIDPDSPTGTTTVPGIISTGADAPDAATGSLSALVAPPGPLAGILAAVAAANAAAAGAP